MEARLHIALAHSMLLDRVGDAPTVTPMRNRQRAMQVAPTARIQQLTIVSYQRWQY
jgi:hypothetical protein